MSIWTCCSFIHLLCSICIDDVPSLQLFVSYELGAAKNRAKASISPVKSALHCKYNAHKHMLLTLYFFMACFLTAQQQTYRHEALYLLAALLPVLLLPDMLGRIYSPCSNIKDLVNINKPNNNKSWKKDRGKFMHNESTKALSKPLITCTG